MNYPEETIMAFQAKEKRSSNVSKSNDLWLKRKDSDEGHSSM
jgi:hypothetical protein